MKNVSLQINPEFYKCGLSCSEVSWPEMYVRNPLIPEIDNTRGKLTVLYFKRVAILEVKAWQK